MRIIVLGGTVFIGRELVRQLHAAGHEVLVVHRGEHEPDDLPDVEHLHVDRAELGSRAADLAAFRADAAIDNFAMDAASADIALGALGDVRLAVTSSMDVYAAYGALMEGRSGEPVPVDETGPVRAKRYPYAGKGPKGDTYEKLDVEERYLARGATVLRLPIVYGPHDGQRREWYALRRIAAGRTRMPVGTGSWLSTKGYVVDVARGMRLALESDGSAGEVFNLGEDASYTTADWTRMIADAAGADLELVQVPDAALPPDLEMLGTIPQHLLVSSAKARDLLGWTTTPASEALAVSVPWHLENPPSDTFDPGPDDEALAAALAPSA